MVIYVPDGSFAFQQLLFIDKTIVGLGMLNTTGKETRYPYNIKYLAYFKRTGRRYTLLIMGATFSKPAVRQYNMMNATLRNFKATRNYVPYFHTYNDDRNNRTNIKIALIIISSHAH